MSECTNRSLGPWTRRKAAARSERARQRANRRWELDRQRRDALAAIAPEQRADQIARRIIVIDNERDAREAIIYACDSIAEARRKLRCVLKRP